MTDNIETIFFPGVGIEIIFNINSSSPQISPSIIFDCDHENNLITISQTTPPIHPKKKFKTMDITTLVKSKKLKLLRLGLNCSLKSINSHYELAGGKSTEALILNYKNKNNYV